MASKDHLRERTSDNDKHKLKKSQANERLKNNKLNNTDENGQKSSFLNKLNIVLVVLIIISAAVLVYITIDFPKDEKKISVRSIIPLREDGIINGHEHIFKAGLADRWLSAMDKVGVSTTIMLGSPDATFLMASGSFSKYEENNEELFKLVDKNPDRFVAFPTIHTYDDNKLELVKEYIKRGALGIKLYSGHLGSFWGVQGPLNHKTMKPVYDYCQREKVPLLWHVHLGNETIKAEFEDVLKEFPNLIINVPHFMMSSIITSRLEHFLNTYPNLYTDISFGYFAHAGLWRLSNNTDWYRRILTDYQDRFMFGTDMVVTKHSRKDSEWIANLTQGYRDLLEKEYYTLFVPGDIEGDFNGDKPGTHSGLNLSNKVLAKIYYDNPVKFLNCRFYYENLTKIISESELTFSERMSNNSNSGVNSSINRGLDNYKFALASLDKKSNLVIF